MKITICEHIDISQLNIEISKDIFTVLTINENQIITRSCKKCYNEIKELEDKNIDLIAKATAQVVFIDFWFTGISGIIQPITGFTMVYLYNYSFFSFSAIKPTFCLMQEFLVYVDSLRI